MKPETREKAKRIHRGITAAGGALFVAAAVAGWRVLQGAPSADLPELVYRLGPAPGSRPLPRSEPRLRWEAWGPEGLDRARREGRLVLLHLAPSWCGPCRLMEETTYAEPRVAEWAEERTVPLRADPESRPDLALLYGGGGWPVTALLLPGGELLSGGSYVAPDAFLPWARGVDQAWRRASAAIEEKRSQARERAAADRDARGRRAAPEEASLRDELRRIEAGLVTRYDAATGGIGVAPRFARAEPLAFLLARLPEGRPRLREAAWGLLAGLLKLEDPVDGGFFRAAARPDWTEPSHEKLLETQAELALLLLEAHRALEAPQALEAAKRTLAYMERRLLLPGGGFRASEPAEWRAEGRLVEGRDYYAQGAEARRALGAPVPDERQLAGPSARAAEAWLVAGRRLGRRDLLERGQRSVERLLARMDPDGAVLREEGGRSGFASDQAAFARAALAAYDHAGEDRFLQAAEAALERSRRGARGELLAAGPKEDGDVEPPPDPGATLAAAQAWLELYRRTGRPEHRERARAAWSWCAANGDLFSPPEWGSAALRFLADKPSL